MTTNRSLFMPATTVQSNQTLHLGIAQFLPTLADKAANLEKIVRFVEQAEEQGVDLLLFPELALTGYPVGNWFSEAAITADCDEIKKLKALSKRVAIVVGVIEESEAVEFFNTALYLKDGEVRHLHRKIYLPTYRQFDERRYFMAGWSVNAFNTPWCRMAILICGDCWHLTLPYLAVHDGADVLLVLAASSKEGLTQEISSPDAWQRMNRSYALTLSTFVAFANLVGSSHDMQFWGGSHVVLPNGNLLAQANFEKEDLLTAELDLKLLRKQRLILPFRRDDSLTLTTELGRQILRRNANRQRGFNCVPHPKSMMAPPSPTIEPPFPPIGVSESALNQPAENAPPPITPARESHEK